MLFILQCEGDISAFSGPDKKEWVQHLIDTSKAGDFAATAEASSSLDVQHAMAEMAAAAVESAAEAAEDNTNSATNAVNSAEQSKHDVPMADFTRQELEAEAALISGDLDMRSLSSSASTGPAPYPVQQVLVEESWRDIIMRLRTCIQKLATSPAKEFRWIHMRRI